MHAFHFSDIVASAAGEFGAYFAQNVALAGFTTLRLGGPAPVMVTCATTEQVVGVVGRLDRAGVPVLVLGGGSNLVVADEGVDAAVVRIANTSFEIRDGHVHAEAGVVWDDLVEATVGAGLGGLECLSGIPGSTGATPVQNVGAYGVEIASALRRVQLLDRRDGTVSWVGPEALHLTYRHSVLKHSDEALVLAVELDLREDGLSAPVGYRELARALDVEEGGRVPAAQARAAVLGLRRGKGMVLDAPDHDTWSAGSFFTNPIIPQEQLPQVEAAVAAKLGPDARMPQFPDGDGRVKLSAGWLIERAGFAKGFPGEGAPMRLSTKHTLALTNRGAARTSDLVELARTVRDGVEAAFGVRLVPEPVFVGARL